MQSVFEFDAKARIKVILEEVSIAKLAKPANSYKNPDMAAEEFSEFSNICKPSTEDPKPEDLSYKVILVAKQKEQTTEKSPGLTQEQANWQKQVARITSKMKPENRMSFNR